NQCPDQQMALKTALALSCNTTFSRLCVEEIGPEKIADMAARFGFEEGYSTPLDVVASTTGTLGDKATLAQTCIGQNEVAATPFQMAMLSAAIANGGSRMAPHLVKELQAPDQTTLERTTSEKLDNPVDADIAAQLQQMMIGVVTNGTGDNARIDGVTVGGKTGTAEHGDGVPEHGWFTGFAMGDDGKPAVAVAVFLDSAGDGGSGEATSIAGAVMKAALGK
ncbi:MAG TPA: penicillin-binding transpeptidase domain-containing protein, partial [Phytomonospora sp.]